MGLDEEREFRTLLKEKRHTELIKILTEIAAQLKENPLEESMQKLLSEIAKKEPDDTASAGMIAISKVIEKQIEDSKAEREEFYRNRHTAWLFKVRNDEDGDIDSVLVRVIK